jgi:hypothetical protein
LAKAPAAGLPAELRSALSPSPEPLALPRLAPRPPAALRPPPPAAFVVELPPAGDLSYFDAPRVVGWAIATGFSGCIWLAPSSAQSQPLNALADDTAPHRELYLENGSLIGAFSTIPTDGLIDFLAPLWSRPQRQRALAAVADLDTGPPLPTLPRDQLDRLGDANLLRRPMAMTHLANYMSELCSRALSAGPGRYRVLPRALTNNQRIETALPLRRLLVEGLRRGATLDFLLMRLGPPSTCLRPTAVIGAREGGAALHDAGLAAAEELALGCFDGQSSLSEIAAEAGLGEHAVYVVAYALLCLGAVAVPRQSPKAIPRPQPALAVSPLPPPVATPPPVAVAPPVVPPAPAPARPSPEPPPQRVAIGDAEAAIRRVQQKFRQVEEADYFTLLELSPSASTADVEHAHQALRAEFTPAALPYRCRSGLDRELRQIARALDEAQAVLGDETARRAYLRQIERPATAS